MTSVSLRVLTPQPPVPLVLTPWPPLPSGPHPLSPSPFGRGGTQGEVARRVFCSRVAEFWLLRQAVSRAFSRDGSASSPQTSAAIRARPRAAPSAYSRRASCMDAAAQSGHTRFEVSPAARAARLHRRLLLC